MQHMHPNSHVVFRKFFAFIDTLFLRSERQPGTAIEYMQEPECQVETANSHLHCSQSFLLPHPIDLFPPFDLLLWRTGQI